MNQLSILKAPYSRPPIIEAVLALHFADPLTEKEIASFTRKLKKKFPWEEKLNHLTANIDIATGQASSFVANAGFKLDSPDRSQLVIIQPGVLAAIQRPPYTSWEALSGLAHEQWDALKKVRSFSRLAKVSTRFINRIDIPAVKDQVLDLPQYLAAGLSLPDFAQRKSLTNFYVNCALLDEDAKFTNVLQLAVTPSPLIDHLSFIIDIDISSNLPVPMRDDELWEFIGGLQDRKNQLFESCITDHTRALFR